MTSSRSSCGEPTTRDGQADAEVPEPLLVARIDTSFFEELVVGSGTVSVDDISGFSVSDGTLALRVQVVESEVGGNLIFSALIFADLARDAFDLIDFGGTYERFELYRTP
ncbi:MAG: hypothetical protein AAFZ38_11315 [Myxococcota bacterium]